MENRKGSPMTRTNRPDDDWRSDLLRELAEAETIGQVLHVRGRAMAADEAARTQRWGVTARNRAVELKLRAERKAGRLLAGLGLRGGDRQHGAQKGRVTLAQLDVSRKDSSLWQEIAKIPEPTLSDYVRASDAAGSRISTAGLIRFWEQTGGDGRRTARASRGNRRQASESACLSRETRQSSISVTGARAVATRVDSPAVMTEMLDELDSHCDQLLRMFDFDGKAYEAELTPRHYRAASHFLSQMKSLATRLKERENTPPFHFGNSLCFLLAGLF